MRSLASRSMPIPTLYVKSLGKSCDQDDIRSIFEKARETGPCLLVFEDIDSLVSDDVKSFFLNEVDGLEENDGIMMVGSTNYCVFTPQRTSEWLAALTRVSAVDRLDAGISKRPSRFDRKYHFALPATPERIQYCEYWRLVPNTSGRHCLLCWYVSIDQSCQRTHLLDCPSRYPLRLPASPRVSASHIFKKPSSPPCCRSFKRRKRIWSNPMLQEFLHLMISVRMRCGRRLASRSKRYAKKWKTAGRVWKMPRRIACWATLVRAPLPRPALDFQGSVLVVDTLLLRGITLLSCMISSLVHSGREWFALINPLHPCMITILGQ